MALSFSRWREKVALAKQGSDEGASARDDIAASKVYADVMSVPRQVTIFAFVGVAAAVAHYGALIGLVELAKWQPVPATLVGYVCGGIVSYILNRRHTYQSTRPHEEATWRFAVVAAIGFCLTWLCMYVLNERLGLQYLIAQIITTLIVMAWSFGAHKWFTFRDA